MREARRCRKGLAAGLEEATGLSVDGEAGTAYTSALDGHIRAVPLPDGPAAGQESRDVALLPYPLTGLCLLEQ
ncbi:hypothetical protein [Streptomyces sp. B1I3]|uniref:hypothetical protein n=1 Tax=Streptomyces sp. B1I3 TaxID=3042264 RepID=UPI002780C495|nr:hypothetical protein [Streptomyces sp. B1I3]MDQ0792509.1 hypothetical protein [Streptomyces sp. B1I3]